MRNSKKSNTFAHAFEIQVYFRTQGDPLAQQVEHNTFNVGVLGSSPKRITKTERQLSQQITVFFYLYTSEEQILRTGQQKFYEDCLL